MKKILIVDDDTDILFMLKTYLVFKGFETKVSASCSEGLDTFYSFQPDVVLLDINVGSEDGRLMCRTIKAGAEHQHIPVIFISANPGGLEAYSDYGAYAAVEKPFNFPGLLNLLNEAAAGR